MASGTAGTLSNAGGILVVEDFVPEDDDEDGKPDGAIANATGRTGVQVASTLGSLENTGTIYVEGLDSAGIRFANGWSGDFDNSGTIYVVGDNSVAIATGDIATDLDRKSTRLNSSH